MGSEMSCEVGDERDLDGGIAQDPVRRPGPWNHAMSGSDAIAIRARGLSKTFRVHLRPSDVLRELFSRRQRSIERHALRDVSFDVCRGEVVGVLGRNGAGKSTLLKIIAGTLDRTAGELEVNGRITAILELGTGFHPDYSGRENIRLGGLCLGMSREEVERKTESIIDFSELRDVIDQPFRTYSTGMQARLTFATAISVDPDILIIDEALAVGDARFQMKCFARMTELRKQGRTILIVSHDTNAITSFCDRAIVLEGGTVFAQGTARDMAAAYLRLLFGEGRRPDGEFQSEDASSPTQVDKSVTEDAAPSVVGGAALETQVPDGGSEPAPRLDLPPSASLEHATTPENEITHRRFGDGAVRVISFGLRDERGRETRLLVSGGKYRFHMRGLCVRDVDRVSCGFAIKDRRGTVLFGVTNISHGDPIDGLRTGEVVDIATDLTMWLAAGDYFVNLGFGYLANGEMCDFLEDGIQFAVHGPGGIFTTAVVNLQADFRVTRSSQPDLVQLSAGN
jgi:ABC-type polysaccharide/polyol phosphate transport system ATPase subunit